jgi:hypothetical protein
MQGEAIVLSPIPAAPSWPHFRPSPGWAGLCAAAFAAALMEMTQVSPFLYFRF